MPIFTVEQHFNFALISLTIAPSTFLALTVFSFTYFYIIYTRNNPLPRGALNSKSTPAEYDDNRGTRRPFRRPSFFRRFSARLRTRKQQRARPIPPFWLSFPSLWIPLRQRIGNGGLGIG